MKHFCAVRTGLPQKSQLEFEGVWFILFIALPAIFLGFLLMGELPDSAVSFLIDFHSAIRSEVMSFQGSTFISLVRRAARVLSTGEL